MAMLSPVRGLRPWRTPRVFVENVPNPAMATLSSRASESLIAENTASTKAEACALVIEASVATWAERSDFFIRGSFAMDGRATPDGGVSPVAYDGARGITEHNVRIEAVVLERTMTLLNCHDLDIDDKRQSRLHRIQRAAAARPLGMDFGRSERREFIHRRPRPRPHLACTDRPGANAVRARSHAAEPPCK